VVYLTLIKGAFGLYCQLTTHEVWLAQGGAAKLLATHLAQEATEGALKRKLRQANYAATCGHEPNVL
jgi:predicted chitinase